MSCGCLHLEPPSSLNLGPAAEIALGLVREAVMAGAVVKVGHEDNGFFAEAVIGGKPQMRYFKEAGLEGPLYVAAEQALMELGLDTR